MKNNNSMLAITKRVGQETTGTAVPCFAYAIDGSDLIFAAFMGAQVALTGLQGILWGKHKLQLSHPHLIVDVPKGPEKFHIAPIDSVNKATGYWVNNAMLTVMPKAKATYVMDLNPTRGAPISPETVTVIGQRVQDITTAPLMAKWYPTVVNAARSYPDDRNPLVKLALCENCRVWTVSKSGDDWATLTSKLLSENKLFIEGVQ